MTRPERDRPDDASQGDDRFWQAFAQAAGFDEELRELIASGQIDAADVDAAPEDLLAADGFREVLLAARPIPVERAPKPSSWRGWIAAGALAAIGTAAAVAAVVWLGQGSAPIDDSGQEVAAAELAEAWIAVRESSTEPDALFVDDVDSPEPVEALEFDETPDWLALAVEKEAELAAGTIEEGTP